MERPLTPEEAAKILSVSPKSIREWLRTKKLKGVKIGRLWRIREDDLKSLLFEPEFAEKRAEPKEEERRREWDQMTREERIERIESIQVKCSDLDISTEQFLRHKREDLDREEQRSQKRRSA